VLRDITLLEQSDKQLADAPIHIYEPRPGLRTARGGRADFTFTLKDTPKDSLEIVIADSAGAVIRTLRTMAKAGTNRATWDLRHDGPRQPELRTTPPDNPRIWDEPRFKNKDTRIVDHWGIAPPQHDGAVAAPGRYTVKIVAGGATATQAFTVLKDKSLPTSSADLVASTAAQVRAVNGINGTVDIINRLEILRKQMEDLTSAEGTPAATKAELAALDKKALDVELQLLSRTELHSDDKWFAERHRLYMEMLWLSAELGTGGGDVAGGAEYRPTAAQATTLGELETDLVAAKAAFTRLMSQDVKAFNDKKGPQLSDVLAKKGPAVIQ
jgi:hypothetical protein